MGKDNKENKDNKSDTRYKENPFDLGVDNRIALLVDHYFHFFEIPEYLPYDLRKRFYIRLSRIFRTMDETARIRKKKDRALARLLDDDVQEFFDGVFEDMDNATLEMEEAKSRFNALETVCNTGHNVDASRFALLLYTQENYNWKL